MAPSLDIERLRTVQLVPLTAFDADNRLNLTPMRTLTGRLYEAGIRVFIPCAGSAEFHSLGGDEIVASIEMTRQTAGDEAVIVAPIGYRWEAAVDLASRSVAVGASAALVMPLAFPYLSDEGARDYYRRILDESPCPVLVYKKAEVPSDRLLLDLAEHPNMIGVKYAVNDIDAFNRVMHDDGGRVEWFCGSAERFATFFMLAGATGYTSGAGNICPRLTLAMHAAASAGDWTEAMRLQQVIRPIEDFRARAGSSFNISFLKQAVRQTGLDFGAPRPPYRQLAAEEIAEIERVTATILEAEQKLAAATVGAG